MFVEVTVDGFENPATAVQALQSKSFHVSLKKKVYKINSILVQ